jgi:ChpA-C
MYGRIHVLKKFTAAGFVAAAATGTILLASPAHAGIDTDGTGGIVSGNQIIVPISIPVDVCGNAIAVVGHSGAFCRGGAVVGSRHHGYHGES